jgi:hypothetical protein
MRIAPVICLVAACLVGCGEAGGQAADPFSGPAVCTSGLTRSINESEGPDMGPGRACVSCHADANVTGGEGDAPIFAFAGTVYPSAHEPEDCIASLSEGAELEITDAKGNVFTTTVNATGNFYDDPPGFEYPYHAKVRFQGRVRAMAAPQMIGDCNGCHTQKGDLAAPGRILLP